MFSHRLLRTLIATVVIAPASVLAGVQPSAGQEPEAALTELKSQVLDLDRDAFAAESHRPLAQEPKLAVYLGEQANDLVIRAASLQIDNLEPQRYQYSERESRGLLNHGLHRLYFSTLAKAAHHLRLDVIATHANAKPGELRVRARIERNFRNDAPLTQFVLELQPAGYVQDAGLLLTEAGSSIEPELRAVDFTLKTGHAFAAARELMHIQADRSALPPQYYSLLADSLHEMGLNQRAAVLYQKVQGGPAEPSGDNESPLTAAYNSGVAALSRGDVGGVAILDGIGKSEVADPASLALRDRANLVLGEFLLHQNQGDRAADVLGRVRSPGPYGNAALLGYGWAFLVPAGKKDEPLIKLNTLTYDAGGANSQRLTVTPPAGKNGELALRQALVPWVELTGRDPLDPAVQEGMVAVAWALEHLDAHDQAQDYYSRAIDLLEQTRARLDVAIKDLGDGHIFDAAYERHGNTGEGWPWWFAYLPDERWWYDGMQNAQGAFYLDHLIGQNDFQSGLDDYGNVRELSGVLDVDARALKDDSENPQSRELLDRISALQPRLAAEADRQHRHLAEIATATLKEEKRQTERYLAESHFALARIYDQPLQVAVP